jgi:hypothetical protein
MVRTFESLECDGKNNFQWDRYDAQPPGAEQDYLLLKRYDQPFGMDLPFEIMVTSAEDQEQMVVTAIAPLPNGGARLSVLRGENEPAKDLRFRMPGNATYFECTDSIFPRFAPDEWSCDTAKYWNKDGWCARARLSRRDLRSVDAGGCIGLAAATATAGRTIRTAA